MAKRGQLTKAINQKAIDLIGRGISQRELRLMPYVQSVSVNNRHIDFTKVNSDEVDILRKWKAQGWVVDIEPNFKMTKVFWEVIHELVYMAYVIYDELEDE